MTQGLGTQLRRLVQLFDGDLEAVYAACGTVFKLRYYPIVTALLSSGELTLKDLAGRMGVTHSAVSQTVREMIAESLLSARSGDDARERRLRLTSEGKRVARKLQPLWAAVADAANELQSELGYPLGKLLDETAERLAHEGFAARIERRLGPPSDHRP